MLYLYALCPAPTHPLTLPAGMVQETVQLITVGELGAIVEPDVDIAALKDQDDRLMQAVLNHDRTLIALFSQTALLPLRFGTQFAHRTSLEQHLQQQQQTYLQKLSTLMDRAEYLLTLTPQTPEPPPVEASTSGRAYFLAKKQRLQAQAQVQQTQTAELTSFLHHLEEMGVPFVTSPARDGHERLNLLLSRDGEIVQTQVNAWQASHLRHWAVTCSDPLPPYHFAA